jgi:hypothetical protein
MSPVRPAPRAPSRPDRRRFGPHRRVSLLPALFLVASVLAAACDSASPSPSPSANASTSPSTPAVSSGGPTEDPATLYARIEGQVEAIRGLHPKTKVDPKVLDDGGLKQLIRDSFSRDNPPDVMAANDRLYKALGMIPEGASLTDLYVKLLGSSVAGLYDDKTKQLYVVSRTGRIGPLEKETFAHEYTHALQDQNFDLKGLGLDQIGQGDQSFARLSLIEGDATLLMTLWQLQNLTIADQLEILGAAGSDESVKVLGTMPPILREALFFPYTHGLQFVQTLQTSGGWPAVDAAFDKPPASTEQILHVDRYRAGEKPIAVTLPATLASDLGAGWKVTLEDSFGEFQFQVWLKGPGGADASGDALPAAQGWGGDRLAVVEGPNHAWAVVLRTAWDTPSDAAEFETAATPLVDALTTPAGILPGAGGNERWAVIASDDASLTKLTGVLGLAG